jgi:uncharacterized protein (TIGR02099 family)
VSSFLRPLWFLLTFVTVLLAIATTGGRVSMLLLDRLEPHLNAVLEHSDVELGGLRGRWRFLNPVIEVDSVRFAGGRAAGVTFELDLLRSAFHGSIVARQAEVRRLELALTRDDHGWHVGPRRTPSAAAPDLGRMLRRARSVSLPELRVVFVDARAAPVATADADPSDPAPLGRLHGSMVLAGGMLTHRARVTLRNPAQNCSVCAIEFAMDVDEGLRRPQRVALRAVANEFAVPRALGEAAGFGGVWLERLHADWQLAHGAGYGRVDVALRDFVWPHGAIDHFALTLDGTASLPDAQLNAVGRMHAAAGDVQLDIADGRLELELGDAPRLAFAFADLDVAPLIGIVRAALIENDDARDWLAGLAPTGTIASLSGSYDVAAGQLHYGASVTDVALTYFRGAPHVRGLTATVVGTERALELRLGQRELTFGFYDIYDEPLTFLTAAGRIRFHFADGYLGIRGDDLLLGYDGAVAHGGFALSRPQDERERRLMVDVDVRELSVAAARPLVPRILSDELRAWLDSAVEEGRFERLHVAYQGHLPHELAPPVRQLEVAIALRDAQLRFHPDWPEARRLDGVLTVTGAGVHADITAGELGGLSVSAGRVVVPAGAQHVDVELEGAADGSAVMAFLTATPVGPALPDVVTAWRAAGPITYRTTLSVPIAGAERPPAVRVDAELAGVRLDMPNLELGFEALSGPLRYTYPHAFDSAGLTARLFTHPVAIDVATTGPEIGFDLRGRMSAAALAHWIPHATGVLDGEFDYDARLTVAAGGDTAPPRLHVRSDLVGTTMSLPSALGKDAGEARPTDATLTFTQDAVALALTMDDVGRAELTFAGGDLVRGAIAFGPDTMLPEVTPDGDELWIGGMLDELDLTSFAVGAASAAQAARTINWRLDGLRVGAVRHGALTVADLEIAGSARDGLVQVALAAPTLAGRVAFVPDRPLLLEFDRLHLPAIDAANDAASDADGSRDTWASGALAARLDAIDRSAWPDVDVRIADVRAGSSDFGSWVFDVRREAAGVRFANLSADVRGARVSSETGVIWFDDGRTMMSGRAETANLADMLSRWGFAPTVESRQAAIEGTLSWNGPPLAPQLVGLDGMLAIEIRNGRFVDLQAGSGAQRILSLMNLTKIAKRITMDFSDVFGRGISFDQLDGRFELGDGRLTLTEPMRIDGTGSAFRVSGQVDLMRGTLNNELIVTLPVSENLPWYAAYLAVANPLVAGAVLVGERIFRSQIEQMSSAKYRIEGTFDDPQATLVRVFANEMRTEAISAVEIGEPAAALESEPVLPVPPRTRSGQRTVTQ